MAVAATVAMAVVVLVVVLVAMVVFLVMGLTHASRFTHHQKVALSGVDPDPEVDLVNGQVWRMD